MERKGRLSRIALPAGAALAAGALALSGGADHVQAGGGYCPGAETPNVIKLARAPYAYDQIDYPNRLNLGGGGPDCGYSNAPGDTDDNTGDLVVRFLAGGVVALAVGVGVGSGVVGYMKYKERKYKRFLKSKYE